jgi:2Fe-2S ferredoxin
VPKITYIEQSSGKEYLVETAPGVSVMDAAKRSGVPGIDGDCGGSCVCGTCHIYVDPQWQERVGARSEMEEATIEIAENVQDNSRLACQVIITEVLDGLVVHIPKP